jgi:hypothetical protein
MIFPACEYNGRRHVGRYDVGGGKKVRRRSKNVVFTQVAALHAVYVLSFPIARLHRKKLTLSGFKKII